MHCNGQVMITFTNPEKRQPTPPTVWRNPIHFCAFGFGSGTLPLMPGTWGTIAAIPLYLFIYDWPLWWYLLAVAVTFVFGCWICHIAARDSGVHDHSGIVWDEIVGYLITMIAAPHHWIWVVIGFFLFRLFDVWKLWPIRWLDKTVKGGLGIMLDDVLAGVYALAILQLIAFAWGRF